MRPVIRFLILTAALVLILAACASERPNVITAPPPQSHSPRQYVIQPGDQLDIKFFYNPELNETVPVRPDGKISLQLVDEIQAAGLTPSRLDETLTERYSKELRKPVVTVIIRSFASQRVYVGGEVNAQGLIELTAGMTPLQAVLSAGGLKETAKPEAAIVIRKGPENQPVPFEVNLKNALYGSGSGIEMQLQPYDIVYVPRSSIANANLFVKQYLRDLLPINFGLGFYYNIANTN